MGRLRLITPFVLIILLCVVAAESGDWPCFHGPKRDNLSPETGLLKAWPEEGPKLLWTAEEMGHGYSAVAIAAGRIYTAGMKDKQTYVTALDLSGKILWQKLNGRSWQASSYQTWAVPYAGSRGTPTVDGDTVYHLSDLGRLAALDTRTGEERWHLDIMEAFRAERPEYGYSESVLIDGKKLFCCPAGEGGYLVALDKETGRTLWSSPALKDAVGNGSCVLARLDGHSQLITLSASSVLSFDPENGRLLWEFPFVNSRENNCADAVVGGGLVYASSGYGKGSILLRPERRTDGTYAVDTVWSSELMDNHHGGVLLLDGYLYGAGHNARGFFCLDFKTGAQQWKARGKGSLTYADGHLYIQEERGTMSLVKAAPDKWEEKSSFRIPRGGEGFYWAHPVICGGRLYVRHSDHLYAYDIRED
jgi:outer membrane protein assembly factor BamB